jgi:hypothetical protein
MPYTSKAWLLKKLNVLPYALFLLFTRALFITHSHSIHVLSQNCSFAAVRGRLITRQRQSALQPCWPRWKVLCTITRYDSHKSICIPFPSGSNPTLHGNFFLAFCLSTSSRVGFHSAIGSVRKQEGGGGRHDKEPAPLV